MKKLTNFIVIISIFFVQGCFPTFDHAVVDPQLNPRDDRLLGLWEADPSFYKDMKENDYGFMLFLPCQESFCITFYSLTDGKQGEIFHMMGHGAVIDGKGYLNYQFYGEDTDEKRHHLARYHLMADRTLRLNLINSPKIEMMIKEETVQGTVTEKPDGFWSIKDIHVSSDRTQLLEVLKEHDLFDEQAFGVYCYVQQGLSEKIINHMQKAKLEE